MAFCTSSASLAAFGVFSERGVLPKSPRDALYNLVARNRYRAFGKYDVCLMPENKYRKKFLDLVTTQPS